MFSIGFGEIIVIIFLAIFLIGPKQIPDVIEFFKVIMRCWRRLSKEFKTIVQEERQHKSLMDELKSLRNSNEDKQP